MAIKPKNPKIVMAKPKPRKPATSVAKPKASRGSKSDKQMGDMNQRESYNAKRDANNKAVARWAPMKVTTSADKVTKSRAGLKVKGEKTLYPMHKEVLAARKLRNEQRAGGKAGVTSAGKSNPKKRPAGTGGSMPKYTPSPKAMRSAIKKARSK
jgi:hypothetical protein